MGEPLALTHPPAAWAYFRRAEAAVTSVVEGIRPRWQGRWGEPLALTHPPATWAYFNCCAELVGFGMHWEFVGHFPHPP